jgi:DNA-binding transcriptional ArsR family regulator
MDANQDAQQWGALADGTRLAIVARLADGPQAVGKLAGSARWPGTPMPWKRQLRRVHD